MSAAVLSLEGKVALVTGAASGIGKATVLLFARAGAKVAAVDHNAEKLRTVVDEINSQSADSASGHVADVSDAKAMEMAVGEAAERWGGVDVVFANAGINGVWAPLDELTPDEFNRTLAVNLTGTFLTLKYCLPYLKETGGAVVVTASINGTRVFSNTGASAYSCSKAGQVALAKMAALELAQHKVRVNVICPGAITTPIHGKTKRRHLEDIGELVEYPEGDIPLTDGKPGSPDDVARLVLFLSSDAAKHITGTEMWIDGGQSLLVG